MAITIVALLLLGKMLLLEGAKPMLWLPQDSGVVSSDAFEQSIRN